MGEGPGSSGAWVLSACKTNHCYGSKPRNIALFVEADRPEHRVELVAGADTVRLTNDADDVWVGLLDSACGTRGRASISCGTSGTHGCHAVGSNWLMSLTTMVIVVAHLLVSGFALAEAPRDQLPGVVGRDNRTPLDSSAWPWRAVGRLNQGTGAHCTAALIAPDAVLTAAHCVFHAGSGRLLNPREVQFVAGYRRGDYLAHSRGRALNVAPGFAFTRQPQLDDVANDWVIIRLEQPLEIRPIPLRALPSIGVTKEPEPHLQRVGYDQDRAHLLSLQDGCRVLDLVADDRVIVTDCDGPRGASGSPLLLRESGQVWIVGVMCAIGQGPLGEATLAVHASPLIDHLTD